MKQQVLIAREWGSGIEGLDLRFSRYKGIDFPWHFHADAVGVCLNTQGAQYLTTKKETTLTPFGSIVLLNSYAPHANVPHETAGSTYRSFYLQHSFLVHLMGECGFSSSLLPDFTVPLIHDRDIFVRLVQLHQLLETPTAGGTLEQDTLMVEGFGALLSRYIRHPLRPGKAGYEHHTIRKVREYLHDAWAEPVTLEDLMQVSGLSRSHLVRVFRDTVGMPPHQYLTVIRLNHAKELIRRGEPVSQVAMMCGFTDQSHLSRHFKRVFGVTPGDFAKNTKCLHTTDIPLGNVCGFPELEGWKG